MNNMQRVGSSPHGNVTYLMWI